MEQPKRLYRSTTNRIFGGVCGGLGEYFAIDPTLVRIAFVVLGLSGGFGILAYVVLWLVIPERGQDQMPIEQRAQVAAQEMTATVNRSVQADTSPSHLSGRMILGGMLILIGVMALGNTLFPWHWIRWDVFWALVIVAIGLSIILKRK